MHTAVKLLIPVLIGQLLASAALAQVSSKAAILSPLPAIVGALKGHWILSVKFEPASGMPTGTEGRGEETWREALGGKAAVTEEAWKAGAADISVLGVLWWDAKDESLHAMDCNNQGKRVCDPQDAAESVVVRWSGTELSIEEPERSPDGKTVTSRVTFKDIKADSFVEIDSMETSPGKFETMTTIRAVRSVK